MSCPGQGELRRHMLRCAGLALMALAASSASGQAAAQGAGVLPGEPRVPPPPASSQAKAPQPPPPEPWRKRVSVSAGGGGWRHTFSGVELSGSEVRGGVALTWKRGPQRAGLELELVDALQSASNIQVVRELASGSGSGYRQAVAGVVTGGLGYQWVKPRLHPYLQAKLGIAAGLEETRIDFAVHTDTETLPIGTLYGYDLAQADDFQGIFFSPAVALEVGLEPFVKGANALDLALVGSYWVSNKTFSVGLILRFGHDVDKPARRRS